jgi:hypothetical protein
MSDRDRKPQFRRGPGKPFEKGRKSGGRPVWRERDASPDGAVILYGWHTVSAALANPQRQIRKLFLTENAARRLAEEKIDTRVTPEIVRPNLIDQRLGPDAVHQGLLAEADPLESPHIDTLAQEASCGARPDHGSACRRDPALRPPRLRSRPSSRRRGIVKATGVLAKSFRSSGAYRHRAASPVRSPPSTNAAPRSVRGSGTKDRIAATSGCLRRRRQMRQLTRET